MTFYKAQYEPKHISQRLYQLHQQQKGEEQMLSNSMSVSARVTPTPPMQQFSSSPVKPQPQPQRQQSHLAKENTVSQVKEHWRELEQRDYITQNHSLLFSQNDFQQVKDKMQQQNRKAKLQNLKKYKDSFQSRVQTINLSKNSIIPQFAEQAQLRLSLFRSFSSVFDQNKKEEKPKYLVYQNHELARQVTGVLAGLKITNKGLMEAASGLGEFIQRKRAQINENTLDLE